MNIVWCRQVRRAEPRHHRHHLPVSLHQSSPDRGGQCDQSRGELGQHHRLSCLANNHIQGQSEPDLNFISGAASDSGPAQPDQDAGLPPHPPLHPHDRRTEDPEEQTE